MCIVGDRENAQVLTAIAVLHDDPEVEAVKVSVQLKEGITKPSHTARERAVLRWLADNITPWTELLRGMVK